MALRRYNDLCLFWEAGFRLSEAEVPFSLVLFLASEAGKCSIPQMVANPQFPKASRSSFRTLLVFFENTILASEVNPSASNKNYFFPTGSWLRINVDLEIVV